MENMSEELLGLMNDFLDERSFEQRLNMLDAIKWRDDINDRFIDNLAASMDIVISDGPVEERFKELYNCVRTRAKYELQRFR